MHVRKHPLACARTHIHTQGEEMEEDYWEGDTTYSLTASNMSGFISSNTHTLMHVYTHPSQFET